MSANDKRCRQCGITKPIREFALPRHRLCTLCRTHGTVGVVERSAGGTATTRPSVSTSDWQFYLDYSMVRARHARREHEAFQRLAGNPVRTPKKYSTIKLCRRCKQHKPAFQFDHPRDRVCLACFNPNKPSTSLQE